jgi:Uma2 family endonuclease
LADVPATVLKDEEPYPLMSVAEFLSWSGAGHVGKLELVDGVVRAMAPASATHAIIQLNIAATIRDHLRARNSPCRAGTEAPVLPPPGFRSNVRAPDIVVTCAPITDSGVFEEPVLIVEVISPGNETQTWETIRTLSGLASLEEILVVQSTRVEARVFRRRADGTWPAIDEVATLGGRAFARIEALDFNLDMATIYEGTHLAP